MLFKYLTNGSIDGFVVVMQNSPILGLVKHDSEFPVPRFTTPVLVKLENVLTVISQGHAGAIQKTA